MNTIHPSPSAVRADKRKKLSTKNAVLEAAGRVFAERGYAEATSKEICQLAGANSAAVNYYFGGREKLYEEVLVEAHRQMVDLEKLNDISDSHLPPEEKLRIFLKTMLKTAMESSELWGVKVFLREIASPSRSIVKNIDTTVFPKILKIRSIIQEITGLSPDSKKLQWATGFVISSYASFIVLPKALKSLLMIDDGDDFDSLLDAMQAYVLNGLQALKE